MGEKKKKFKAFLDRLDHYRTLPHKYIGEIIDIGPYHCQFQTAIDLSPGSVNGIFTFGDLSSLKEHNRDIEVCLDDFEDD